MLLIFVSVFLSCFGASDEKYSLSLDGEIVVKDVSYEELQNHLRQYSQYDYQVYSETIGEWKPWKEVIDLNKKIGKIASASKEESSFADLLSLPEVFSYRKKLELLPPKDPFLTTTIPAGTYTMGCNFNEGDTCKREYTLDAHKVTISNDFEIMNAAVTVGVYREIMDEYPAEILERITKTSFNTIHLCPSCSKPISCINTNPNIQDRVIAGVII